MNRRALTSLLALLITAHAARAQTSDAFFEKEVLPVLKANCFKCHGDGKTKGGLSLASRDGVLKGGDSGPAVSLEKPEASHLLKAINYKDGLEMPPNGKLAQKDIDVLTRWVRAGVPWTGPSTPVVATPKTKGMRITDQDREYWAYRPVVNPKAPAVKNAKWV